MLLTKEVEVNLCGSNIDYYESKGYLIPKYLDKKKRLRVKRGTTLMVRIEDLSENSGTRVECVCDGCNKKYSTTYHHYFHQNHDGKTYCKDCCMKELFSGENHWNWNKDKSEEERVNRRHIDGYKDFIKNVLDRDNYTCQCCGVHSHNLEVHHLDGYDWCISGRIDVKNGIALCDKCHSNFHSKYGYGQNTKLQFEEWFGKTIELIEQNCEFTKAKLIICLETNEIDEVSFFVKKYNSQETRIYRCCNKKEKTAKGKHYLWHDEYINMSENDLKDYLQWSLHDNSKAIICLNTKEIFYKMTDARNKYNIHSHSLLTKCCKGIANYAGIHPITEEKLKWMYLIDYLN